MKFGPSILLKLMNKNIRRTFQTECRKGVFCSQGLDIRSGLGMKLQAPMNWQGTSFVHSLISPFLLFFCLPLLLFFPFTVFCRNVFARPEVQGHTLIIFSNACFAWIFLQTYSLVMGSLYEMFNDFEASHL